MPQVKMTELWVRTARTQAVREEWRDKDVSNLELRLTAKAKTWRVHYTRSDGQRKAKTLGRYPAVGLADARKAAREVQATVANGADPATTARTRKAAPTFKDVAFMWLAEREAAPDHSPQAVRDDKSMLARHIVPVIGYLKAPDIQKADVLRLIRDVKAKTDGRVKPKTSKPIVAPVATAKAPRKLSVRVNRVFQRTRAILRWALGQDIIKHDPCAGITNPIGKENPRRVVHGDADLRNFWIKLPTAGISDGHVLALKLSLVTAQRIGEVTSIRIADLHLDGERPHWMQPYEAGEAMNKTRKLHLVPLTSLAVTLLHEAMRQSGESPYLFPVKRGATGHLTSNSVSARWGEVREDLGFTGKNVHDLRRTASRTMARLGFKHVRGAVLSHSVKGVTDKHYDDDDPWGYEPEKRAALIAWAAHLEAAIGFGAAGGDVVKPEVPAPNPSP